MAIIAITGTIGAGKGTIVEYLQTKGFTHYSARAFFIKELVRRGMEQSRDNMVLVANELRKTYFPGYAIGELLKEAQQHGGDAVIESIRTAGEIDLLKEKATNVCLLAVDADIKTRYDRVVKRNSSTDNVSFEKFMADEKREFESKDAWSQNLKVCMERADYVLSNDGTFEDLYKQIDEVLVKIQG